jgi:hypothetical protein
MNNHNMKTILAQAGSTLDFHQKAIQSEIIRMMDGKTYRRDGKQANLSSPTRDDVAKTIEIIAAIMGDMARDNVHVLSGMWAFQLAARASMVAALTAELATLQTQMARLSQHETNITTMPDNRIVA